VLAIGTIAQREKLRFDVEGLNNVGFGVHASNSCTAK